MGGDFAPRATVAGAVLALRQCPDIQRLYLVGDEKAIQAELDHLKVKTDERLVIHHASEVVEMEEVPASAVRRKKDSSINRAMDLVKRGEADAVFAAGSTGAAVASATLKLRTLDGIRRAAIAVVMPTPGKPFILLDGGATPDCTADILIQFAVMGTLFSRHILGVERPQVGLMSIGTENAKGNSITKEAFALLKSSPLNFIGNVEGHDLFEGNMDVVVCDGFTGNVILKTSESVAHAIGRWLKLELTKNFIRKLGALLLSGGLRSLRSKTSQKTYGGAPLLGVNGVCIIGHGNSDAEAVKNGIFQAADAVRVKLNQRIMEGVKQATGDKNGMLDTVKNGIFQAADAVRAQLNQRIMEGGAKPVDGDKKEATDNE